MARQGFPWHDLLDHCVVENPLQLLAQSTVLWDFVRPLNQIVRADHPIVVAVIEPEHKFEPVLVLLAKEAQRELVQELKKINAVRFVGLVAGDTACDNIENAIDHGGV